MELLQDFKNYLFSQKKQPSKATVKNYAADIRHFIVWFEAHYKRPFTPTLIQTSDWEQFRQAKIQDLSEASLERHLSSLRKFFYFLSATKCINSNPFDIKVLEVEQKTKDPWMLKEFKEILKKNKAAKLTIKNYSSDIQQFLSWIDKNKKEEISTNRAILPFLNNYFLEQYTQHLTQQEKFSPSSLKRKISSIKKYIGWIEKEVGESFDPLLPPLINHVEDIALDRNNQSEQDIVKNETSASKRFMPSDNIESSLGFEESISPIDASDHPFEFLSDRFDQKYYTSKIIRSKKQSLNKSANKHRYSKIPPVRLFQKMFRLLNGIIDVAVVLPISKGFQEADYLQWVAKGKPVFSKRLFTLPKIAPVHVEKIKSSYINSIEGIHSVKKDLKKQFFHFIDWAIRKRIPEHLRYRPLWYHRYHKYAIAHYFHFAILVIFMSAIGFNLYGAFFGSGNAKPVFASLPTAPPKILSFNGRLTDKNNLPITTRTDVRFAVYNSGVATGSALLWQEVDNVTPDKNGNVSIPLGQKAYLDPKILTDSTALWLGVTVQQAEEMHPRQQLPTTGYAANTETLQGMQPITNQDAGGKNVVLALDSAGNLTMNDSGDHTFQATNGQFTLSGNTLLLSTNPGSSSDVQIAPDGFGEIDLQKPIHNTSQYNNIPSALGSVEVDDTFSILASASGQSAFTLDQNGYGPLLSASSGGVAKFTIANDGSITSAGDLSIKGNVESNLTPFGNNQNIGSSVSQWNNIFAKNIILDGTPLTQTWEENPDSIFPVNQNKNLLIGLTASTSANFEVVAATGAILTQSNITLTGTASAIGTVNNQTLQIGNPTTGAVAINPNNHTGLFVNNNGNVGIGTQTLPDSTALFIQKNLSSGALIAADQQGTGNIFNGSSNGTNKFSIGNNGDTRITGGGLCVSASSNCNSESLTPGTLYASNTTVQSADLAENYIAAQQLQPGDVVMPAGDGNNMAISKSSTAYQSQVIGVVSTQPGVTLNSDAQTDSVHPYKYPIALSGRVPVKVSIANGVVKTGDLLTSSATPGVAMKATEAGPIIGKALEDFSNPTQGTIMAYISVSFGNPNVSLADDGNLNNANQLFSNLNTDQKNTVLSFIDEIANQAQITFNNISSDIISAKNIAVDTLTVHKQLISPVANIAEVHSNMIAPLSNKGNIGIKLNDNNIEIHSGNTGTGSAVATIDNQGNASFSGQLASSNLNVRQDATISGTLHAGKILADQIIGLPTATSSSQYITNITNVYNATPSSDVIASNTSTNQIATSTSSPRNDVNYINIASYSAQFANVPNLDVNTATFEQGLISLGPTSLSDTSITGQLSIGSQFIFADNSINVLGSDLQLQPLRQGGIAFVGGQVYIDTNGNISIQKNETINGTLAANTIAPLANRDLTLKLDNGNTQHPANFSISNTSNSGIFSVNQLGDIIASGAATIQKLNFNLTQSALALSDSEIIASGSAGVATISANKTFVKIDNSLVTGKSLIYITPVGNSGQPAFLMKQVPSDSFTVGVDQPALNPTTFNWLIVN